MKLVKLDRRHTGHHQWRWFATPDIAGKKYIFFLYREWCWEQWGPSKELNEYGYRDLFDGDYASNPHWCWSIVQRVHYRIYLRGDIEASMFTFKWS